MVWLRDMDEAVQPHSSPLSIVTPDNQTRDRSNVLKMSGKMPSDLVGKTFACSSGFIAAFTADDTDRVRDLIKENDRKGIASWYRMAERS